tara:strand:+ start:4099 stop:4368 length:270 start_codon:yes stop_codon:yes gene_type:complete
MPTKKARLQIILADDATDHVKALAEERGLSVSAMCSQLIHSALRDPEFKLKPDLKKFKGLAVEAAIEGTHITDPKVRALLELVEHLTKD